MLGPSLGSRRSLRKKAKPVPRRYPSGRQDVCELGLPDLIQQIDLSISRVVTAVPSRGSASASPHRR